MYALLHEHTVYICTPQPCKLQDIRTLWAAVASADEQSEAGGDNVELAHLLPRRAPRLLQLLLLPPIPHGGVCTWR